MQKIILTTSILFVFSFISVAQTRFGVKVGANSANMSLTSTSSGTTYSSKAIFSFHGGVTSEFKLSDKLVLQPSLLFSRKGASNINLSNGTATNLSFALNYLELPVNVLFKATDKLSIGAGPYLGYALSGTVKGTISNGVLEEKDLTFGGSDEMTRTDVGLNFVAGYEVAHNLVISANYSLSLTNNTNDKTVSVKNNVIGISISKFFAKK